MTYRNLTFEEINNLKNQGCRVVDNWNKIKVEENFITDNIHNVVFSSNVFLGLFNDKIEFEDGSFDFSGIYNAFIHNSKIGSQCYIRNINQSISNYVIDENVIIINTDNIINNKETRFGNGIKISALNEFGEREVVIYEKLTSHIAYLVAFYRDKPKLVDFLNKLGLEYGEEQKSKKGYIGKYAKITNCKKIENVKIHNYTKIDGAILLQEGTIQSYETSIVKIGDGAIISNFIIKNGAKILRNSILNNCFIGAGSLISDGFNAENSFFFAGSECYQGEACSVFLGPFSVSHHKSSLLIAGYYSFFNAGSGTNQSNHMYKLGPMHQGILERGCKTGSNTYIQWPAHIGPFSVALGNHSGHPDTSKLPFSYLIVSNERSTIIPAQNLFTAGIERDADKWKKRSLKNNTITDNYITIEVLNPYTIQLIIKAIEELKNFLKFENENLKGKLYNNVYLSFAAAKRGIRLYEKALIKYVGDVLIDTYDFETKDTILYKDEFCDIADIAGLIVNKNNLLEMIETIKSDKTTLDNINSFFYSQHRKYDKLKRSYAYATLKSIFNIDINALRVSEMRKFVTMWMENNEVIEKTIISDAKNEYNSKMSIGYGLSNNENSRENDFIAVHNKLETNEFINNLQQKYKRLNKKGQEILDKI